MTKNNFLDAIRADFFRYNQCRGFLAMLAGFYGDPGFIYTFWWRLCSFLISSPILKILFYYWAKIVLCHYKYKFGIDIPIGLSVGKGLYIGHFGGIVVGSEVKIGNNLNLSHGVTLGQVNRGAKKGSPVVGNNVYIGTGAKVLGKIQIGNNVAIGANCVVIDDVPDNAVVVGIPGKIVSYNGSQGYVNNTNY